MKLSYKILLIFLFIFLSNNTILASIRGLDGFNENIIDAAKNARLHSNMGNIYFEEKNYNSALSEYKIAYALGKNTQAGATYLYNIARCYMNLGRYNQAFNIMQTVIQKDCLNIVYYETYVDCCIITGCAKNELSKRIKDTQNPYSRVIAGLIYLKTDRKSTAKMIFDDFINEYPDMLISNDISLILKRM